MRKRHVLTSSMGPGLCGAGQGQKARQTVVGYTIETVERDERNLLAVTCQRCTKLWLTREEQLKAEGR